MTDAPHANSTADEPQTGAAELGDQAGPTRGRHAADPEDLLAPRSDSPDAEADPDIDQVRASEDDDAGDVEDEYQLRSIGVHPNPTEDDPGSYLNI